MFVFSVGPDATEFRIHRALVAALSPALDRLVNGDMKEAIDGRASWNEVDAETFIRLGQYAYTGDYDDAKPQKRRNGPCPSSTHDEKPPVPDVEQVIRKRKPARQGHSLSFHETKIQALWRSFQMLHRLSIGTPDIQENQPDEDYTQVFLCHARLYVVADCYGIDGLRRLSLHKLRRSLEWFTLHEDGTTDITELLRYCYDNTVRRSPIDELRDLVNIYTACQLEEMWKNDGFRKLMETNGEFLGGVMAEVLKRLD